jgi:tripartite-type tricarboxylate transporter receptor subunit TctC
MTMRRTAIALAAALAACAGSAAAQNYPVRPIKLIVPFAPGGPADVIGRILGQQLGMILGQSIAAAPAAPSVPASPRWRKATATP